VLSVTDSDSQRAAAMSALLGASYESKFRKLKMEEAIYETLRTEFDSAKVQEARENPYVEVLDMP
jgi:hypothetical protein